MRLETRFGHIYVHECRFVGFVATACGISKLFEFHHSLASLGNSAEVAELCGKIDNCGNANYC